MFLFSQVIFEKYAKIIFWNAKHFHEKAKHFHEKAKHFHEDAKQFHENVDTKLNMFKRFSQNFVTIYEIAHLRKWKRTFLN